MISYLLIAVLGAAIAVTIGYLTLKLRAWRALYHDQRTVYDGTFNQLLESERDAERARQELAALKTTINAFASRPLAIALTDEQIGFLSHEIGQIVVASVKPPHQLN